MVVEGRTLFIGGSRPKNGARVLVEANYVNPSIQPCAAPMCGAADTVFAFVGSWLIVLFTSFEPIIAIQGFQSLAPRNEHRAPNFQNGDAAVVNPVVHAADTH